MLLILMLILTLLILSPYLLGAFVFGEQVRATMYKYVHIKALDESVQAQEEQAKLQPITSLSHDRAAKGCNDFVPRIQNTCVCV